MRRCTPMRLGDLWEGFKHENPLVGRKLAEGNIPQIWRQLLGDGIASMTEELKLRNGTLNVRVSSSVVRQEILMRRLTLTEAINKQAGTKLVDRIIVR